MDESPHPLPSNKKNNKGKKRKRSSKKSSPKKSSLSSSCDKKFNPSNINSKSVDQESEVFSPSKTTKHKANNFKVRSNDYPYPTDYNDHFETPKRAYEDIFPLLLESTQSTKRIQDKKGGCTETTIYDPYFCTGRAATLLNDVFQRHNKKLLTTMRIQHEKRDFYHDIRKKTVPDYDILITNPPYSGNHKERCLDFAVGQLKKYGRPFFLLMPNYVAMKEYFRKIVLDDEDASDSRRFQTLYIAPSPNHPYEYEHPEGTGHQTSPFASVWFCGLSYEEGKTGIKSLTDAFAKFHAHAQYPIGAPRIAASLQELIRTGGVSGEKRKNPRQRKKMRQQAMQRANNGTMGGSNAGANIRDNGGKQSRNNNKRTPGSHSFEHSKKRGNINKRRKSK
mmetsp:Transcript_21990/g.53220  ORF Transcript_21990/g.53220 Transcript_21990/m.53220 type:complete len:392 (+) Transcript_21990:92-1267(+)